MNLLTRLKEIRDLPTLPEVVLQVQYLTSSDDTDARRLTRVIEHDPALASKILRIANSVFFTPTYKRITDLSTAIARIGMAQVRNLAVATEAIRIFPNELHALSHRGFWGHSLAAAYLDEELARQASPAPVKERLIYFLSGLFHDIGILIYDQFFHEEFASIIKVAVDQKIPFLQAEATMPHLPSHAALGGALLETWKLDTDIISAVRYHHTPQKAAEKSRFAVNVASAGETMLCNGSIGAFEGSTSDSLAEACSMVNVSLDTISSLLARCQGEAARYDAVIGSPFGVETLHRPNSVTMDQLHFCPSPHGTNHS